MSSSESQGVGDAGDLLADVGEETAILRQLAKSILDQPEGEELLGIELLDRHFVNFTCRNFHFDSPSGSRPGLPHAQLEKL